MKPTADDEPLGPRQALRKHLLEQRAQFAASPQAGPASAALARHLAGVLAQLEPDRLGLYWPYRSEFNAVVALGVASATSMLRSDMALALPFAQRTPIRMHYRAWDGRAPALRDECGIPSSDGAPLVPDVVLVPCVGFTPQGLRLGYGGGYFDRWLAEHPGVTSIGVALRAGAIDAGGFDAQAHDQALTLVVTEDGVV